MPKGITLRDMEMNFNKRKAKIGGEEWKLLYQETGDVRIIQAREGSEKFEFGLE